MASYSFSTVNDVLPLGAPRAYVPRAARPHLAWAAEASSSALGEHCRLKGDGTAARETRAAQAERERDEDATRATATVGASFSSSSITAASSEVALGALLTTDTVTGTQLTLYHDAAAPGVPVCSTAVPSRRRVVALWSPPSHAAGSPRGLLDGDVPLFVSDDAGNVFRYCWTGHGGPREPAAKRSRREPQAESGDAEAWVSVAVAHSRLSSSVAAFDAAAASTSALDGLFTVTRGAPGWAGLLALNGESDTDTPQLVSTREFYCDVRVIDPVQREVVRVYSTTHAPTGLLCPSVQAAPHCVLVTEGCLATLFDVRCPSAVLSLGDVYTAQAEWTAAKEEAVAEKLRQEQEDHPTPAPMTGTSAPPPPTPPPPPPLVPGRLTSTVGQVRDACNTANPFEIACAVDRALSVYDLRKFNRLFTSSSVLKYVVGSVTPVAGGRGVVCAGIDSEVRLVPLYEKSDGTGAAAKTLSLAARVAAQSQKKRQRSDPPKAAEEAPAVFDVDTMGPGGTFRTRLNTSVSCTSVWQGGWVSTQNLNGVAAVGVSADGELFLAQ